MGNLFGLRPAQAAKYVVEKVRIAKDGELLRLLGLADTPSDAEPRKVGSNIERSVETTNDSAAAVYRPQPYHGKLTVFRPSVNYDVYPDPKMGWNDMAIGGLEVVELPTNPHAMLVAPYVKTLARELRSRLIEAVSKAQDFSVGGK